MTGCSKPIDLGVVGLPVPGLTFVSRSWFNLDAVWAVSLILVGSVALALNASGTY
jgi:hypothetical protein